jgi:zinc-binding in reverse transcriptase
MNYTLLCKWGWKYWYKDSKGYWKELITIKYNSFSLTICSPFWKDVGSVKQFLSIGSTRLIGSFWHDVWHENCSFTLHFPFVFAKVKNDPVSLATVCKDDQVKLSLTRGISNAMRIEKNKLILICQSLYFTTQADSIYWHLDKSELYTVHSSYNFLNSGVVYHSLPRSVWSLKISLKIKLFLWLYLHNKILTKNNLVKRD